MERTNKSKKDNGTIRWKKIGGGSFKLGNRIIKPNQTFSARPDQISEAFRDVIIPIDELPPEPEQIVSEAAEFFVKSRGGGGWYDVVDGNGKVKNERALKKDAAEKLIKTLT